MDTSEQDLTIHMVPMKPSKIISGALLRSVGAIEEAEVLIIAPPDKLNKIKEMLNIVSEG